MGAIWVVFRAELRHRWRSWLALTILVTLVGGTVLGAVAAGRRTASAFPRFITRYGYDVQAFSFSRPLPATIASLPDVSAIYYEVSYDNGNMVTDGHVVPANDAYISGLPSDAMSTTKLVAGRLPTAADEVLAGFTMEQQFGVHIGSIVTVPFYSLAQVGAVENGSPSPRGARVSFRVVGIEANVTDFPSGVTPVYNLYTSPAFDRGEGRQALRFYEALVRLRNGAADLPRFQVDFQHLAGLSPYHGIQSEDSGDTAVERSIHPQAVGWWLFALFVGLVGLAVVGQALSRQSLVEAESYPTLEALGFRPRQVFALGMARAATIGLIGAVGAVVLALAVSPLTPVGEAAHRRADSGLRLRHPRAGSRRSLDRDRGPPSHRLPGLAGDALRASTSHGWSSLPGGLRLPSQPWRGQERRRASSSVPAAHSSGAGDAPPSRSSRRCWERLSP